MECRYNISSTQKQGMEHFVPNLFKWNGAEMVFLVILFVFGIAGNVLVMYTYHFKWRRSNFTLFIEVLAAIDLSNCLLSVTLFFVMTVYKGELFEIFCGTASYVAFVTTMASSIVLVIVAYERKRKIYNPLKQVVTIGMTKKLCLSAVVVGMTVSIPGTFLFGKTETVYVDNGHAFNLTWCFFKDGAFRSWPMYIWAAVLGIIFIFVILSLSTLYCSIWRHLAVHCKERRSLGQYSGAVDGKADNRNQYRAHKTTAKLFFIVTLTFFVTYFPYFIVLGYLMFKDRTSESLSPIGKAFIDLAKLSPMMSNVINPVIYSLSSARFRKEIVTMFRGVTTPVRSVVSLNLLAKSVVIQSKSVTSVNTDKVCSDKHVLSDVVNDNAVIKLL